MPFTLVLETTAYTAAQIPQFPQAQIALAGRSNVGKSSLINALAGRKSLAKTSASPGKTRSLNFYRVLPDAFYLVDLPGYGYAQCSKAERNSWSRLMNAYLESCSRLRGLALLLDCRLPPQQLDRQLADYARQLRLPLLPVLTKADKCSQKERADCRRRWRDILGLDPLTTSARDKLGIARLQQMLCTLAGEEGCEGARQATAGAEALR